MSGTDLNLQPEDEYETSTKAKGKTKPKIKLPDDFDTEDDFLEDMRRKFNDDFDADRQNYDAALEDLRFITGDQWTNDVRERRERSKKPVLTVNRLPAFVGQIVGQRRLNETTIRVRPDSGGNAAIAKLREGLMRSIQKTSRAGIAYDKALENAAICGIGNFQIKLDYAGYDVFEQDICIEPIPHALAVVWDRMMQDPTGRDAGHVFVIDTMTRKDFEAEYPWARASDMMVDATLRGDLLTNGWMSEEDVRIVSYWRMRSRKRTLALLQDGTTQDITDATQDDPRLATIVQGRDGPIVREVDLPYAEMYYASGADLLSGPYQLPITRVPVFRVPGWEVNVGEFKHRWGLVRFMKDPQRLHNYWRSVIAEKLTQTPKAVWIAQYEAVAGREKDWRNSHLSDDPLLIYNGDAGQKPERAEPAQFERALISEAEITQQDLKDVSNIHEANLGMPSNEVSGAAIIARQRVSDTGTILYHDNLNMAIEEAGRTADELIPVSYDTPRIVKVLGEDGKQDLVRINTDEENDITLGKYNISVVSGASYATKRIEAAESMKATINAAPQIAPYIMDLWVQAQDWPMADQIAKRLRLLLPPGMVDPKDLSPAEQQAMQARAQSQGAQAQQQAAAAAAQTENLQAKTAESLARAHNYATEAQLAPIHASIQAGTAASEAEARELSGHLDAIKTATGD